MEITPPLAATTTSPTSPEPTSALASDFETFLVMLTAQMENQDPLNPLDSQDFATQLATFSGVEQQIKSNELLAALSSQLVTSNLGDMASWVGMEARLAEPANFDGTPITLYPAPPSFADSAQLVVRDATGAEVQRLTIEASDAPVQWAGVNSNGQPFANGTYSFSVEAISDGEVIGSHVPDQFARVSEVRNVSGSAVIVLENGDMHPASSVRGLR